MAKGTITFPLYNYGGTESYDGFAVVIDWEQETGLTDILEPYFRIKYTATLKIGSEGETGIDPTAYYELRFRNYFNFQTKINNNSPRSVEYHFDIPTLELPEGERFQYDTSYVLIKDAYAVKNTNYTDISQSYFYTMNTGEIYKQIDVVRYKMNLEGKIGEYYTTDYESAWVSYDLGVFGQSFKVDTVQYPSKVSTIAKAYIGDKILISINKQIPNAPYLHTITYSMGGISGTIVEQLGGSSPAVNWQSPMSLLDGVAWDATHNTCVITCTTYNTDMSAVIGVETTEIILQLDVNADGPTFSTFYHNDTNSVTVALTGDNSKYIRYHSRILFNCDAVAQGNAGIVEVGYTNGTISDTAKYPSAPSSGQVSGIIEGIESGDFYLWATDSRGASSSNIFSVYLIPYEKLSCNVITQPISTSGSLHISLEGSYYNGSFSNTNSNTLTLNYKLWEDGETEPTEWTNIIYRPESDFGYYIDLHFTNLDYQKIYYFKAQAIDKLETINTDKFTIMGYPIFDWGHSDFNFNVDVSMKKDLTLANGQNIFGTTSGGSSMLALNPCDSTDNIVLGYGSYTDEIGATNIYGNQLNTFSNYNTEINSGGNIDIKATSSAINLNGNTVSITAPEKVEFNSDSDILFNGISVASLLRAFGNSYTLSSYTTTGTNFNTSSCELILRGNCLYCRVYGSRKALSETGDFTDDPICTITFYHDGKITGMDYVSGATSSGPTAVVNMSGITLDEEKASFTVSLTSSAAAGRNFLSSFVIPVSIDLTKFT